MEDIILKLTPGEADTLDIALDGLICNYSGPGAAEEAEALREKIIKAREGK